VREREREREGEREKVEITAKSHTKKGQFNEVVKLQMAVVKVFPHSISIDVVSFSNLKRFWQTQKIYIFLYISHTKPDEKHSSLCAANKFFSIELFTQIKLDFGHFLVYCQTRSILSVSVTLSLTLICVDDKKKK
jgi:hypothetical protein